jgi:uncharacterized protein YndB with AHSA1/START domain
MGGPDKMRIEIDIVINRPVQEVWDFFADLRNSPHWTRSGSEVRQTSAGAMGVGATLESRKLVLRRFDIKSQALVVTKYEPPHLVWYTSKVPLLGSVGGGFAFEPVEQGTRLTLTTDGDGGILGFLGPVLLGFIRSSQQIELRNLKRLVESAAHDPRVDAPTRMVQTGKSLP